MITDWYNYTAFEIASIFEKLGYSVMRDNEMTTCIVLLGDDKVGYFARTPDSKIESVMVLDDEMGRWR